MQGILLKYAKNSAFILLLAIAPLIAEAQQKEEVINNMKRFHRLLVEKSTELGNYLHKDLSYGHSSGWIENRQELLSNNKEGVLVYHAYKEDSISAVVSGNTAWVRFSADIDVTLRGNAASIHLRVLEVYIKEGTGWKIFARQAIR